MEHIDKCEKYLHSLVQDVRGGSNCYENNDIII